MSRIDVAVKEGAYAFLNNLQQELNNKLPNASLMRESVRRALADLKQKSPERVFVNRHALPIVFDAMQTISEIGANEARQALLCEFWKSDAETYCLQTASRTAQSPFLKRYLEKNGLEIIAAWKEGKLERACPDFAFGNPFPYKIVFEGKYFDKESREQAATSLVTTIREAFFYRCFSYAPPSITKPDWDYDFSCAVVYDASDEGYLQSTWMEIPEHVRTSFWDGANLYVMIIRGQIQDANTSSP